MKNFLTSLMVLFLLGCQEHLESNTPAFQGQKNGEFLWKSTTSTAIIDAAGVLTLTGSDGFGKMTLKVRTAKQSLVILRFRKIGFF
jgi:hypothetical protein